MAFDYKSEINRYKKYYQSVEPVFLSPKNRAYTTIIFSFLAVSLFGWYAIKPTVQTILYLRREIKDKTQVNQKMEEKINALIEGQANYEAVQEQISYIGQALPNNPEIVSIVRQLKNLTNLSQASLSAIQTSNLPITEPESTEKTQTNSENPDNPVNTNPKGKDLKNKLIEVPITVTHSGSYAAFKTFIEGLIGMRRIISIGDISIAPGTDTANQGEADANSLQFNLRLKTFYLGDEQSK